MKKSIVLLFAFIFVFGYNLFAQQEKNPISNDQISIPLSLKLYRVAFEIKNNNQPDVNLLAQIPIENYLLLKEQNNSVEATDVTSGYTLIIYPADEDKLVREPDIELIKSYCLLKGYSNLQLQK